MSTPVSMLARLSTTSSSRGPTAASEKLSRAAVASAGGRAAIWPATNFETSAENAVTERVRPGETFELQTQINRGPWIYNLPKDEQAEILEQLVEVVVAPFRWAFSQRFPFPSPKEDIEKRSRTIVPPSAFRRLRFPVEEPQAETGVRPGS